MRPFRNRRDDAVPPYRRELFGRVLDIEYDSPNRSLHVWVGPAGLHLFWPDLWKSRPGWCSNWREPPG